MSDDYIYVQTKYIKSLFKEGKTRREAIDNLIENYNMSEAQAILKINEIYDEMEK